MMLRIAVMNLVKGLDLSRSLRYRLHFLRFLIPTLGVKVTYEGAPPQEAGLIMCNHRSYFDPVPVLRKVWAVPVGKAEVRNWPIIGQGGHLSGTIFVDRTTTEGRQAARDKINQRLAGGYSILIYPEGTIFPGPELGELKMGMFRDAAKHGYLIHPVALEYRHADDVWEAGIGFVKHFFRQFGGGSVEVKVSFGPSIQGDDAQDLADRFKAWLEPEILRLREGWYQG
jgi:1-acyl-sn-glycerol-3-phosphate acyltransferase